MIHFHEDLHSMKVKLSSTSSRFIQRAEEGGALTDLCNLRDTDTAMSILTSDQSSEEQNHWIHVATTMRNNSRLDQKMEFLRRSAVQDLILEEKDNGGSSGKYSIRNTKHIAPSSARHSLPAYLRVPMAKYAPNSKRVSLACISVLEGLLDIRLWCRMGAGVNYSTLQNHVWFEECKLEWQAVEQGKTEPAFTPNITKVTRDLAFKHEQHKVAEKTAITCTTTTGEKRFEEFSSNLKTNDRNILNHFHFVAPQYYSSSSAEVVDSVTDDKANLVTRSTTTDFVASTYFTSAPTTNLHSE